MKSDHSIVPRPSIDDATAAAKKVYSPENHIDYDAEVVRVFDEFDSASVKEVDTPEIQAANKELDTQLQKLADEGYLDDFEIKEFDEIKKVDEQIKNQENISDAAWRCLGIKGE